jgi:uncharacterized protein (TIGR01244 family)
MNAGDFSGSSKNDPADIRNWLRLSDRITTSGRLQAGDPERLARLGVRHVVNLALHEHPEALTDPERQMAQAGLRYTHIPIPFGRPREDHYRAFRAAIEGDDEPVHVHCIMNWRVSAVFYRYNRDVLGMPEPAARALMERIWKPEEMAKEMDGDDARTWAAFIAGKTTGESE